MSSDLTLTQKFELMTEPANSKAMDALRLLVKHTKQKIVNGNQIERLSLFDLHNRLTGLLFPSTVWSGSGSETIYNDHQNYHYLEGAYSRLKEQIQKNRIYYKNSPDILYAIGVLEGLADDYLAIQDMIRQKIDASQVGDLQKAFDARCGNSTYVVVLRDRSAPPRWLEALAEVTGRAITALWRPLSANTQKLLGVRKAPQKDPA